MDCYRDSGLEKPDTKTFYGSGLLKVEAGTNGFHGGDAGHGSSTYFKIENLGGACINADVTKYKDGFEVALGGDWELDEIIESLKFILETLKEQSNKKETSMLESINQARLVLANKLCDRLSELDIRKELDDYLSIVDRYIELTKLIESGILFDEHN